MNDNRSIIRKADMALSDLTAGGLLHPAQAKKFMRLMTVTANLVPKVTYRPMGRSLEEVDQIKFGTRILRAAKELEALPESERVTPNLSKVKLDAQEFIGEVDLSDRVLEENIEQGNFKKTIVELIAPRVGFDLEDAVVNGDTGSTDPFFAQLDGIRVQATSNVVDCAGANFGEDLLHDMISALPPEYKRNKRELRFFTSVRAEEKLQNIRRLRETTLGDTNTTEDIPQKVGGALVVPVPAFPEELGASGNHTEVILTHPKNIVVGVRRKIRFEWERSARHRATTVVVTLLADVKYAEENGVVKAINCAV